MLKTYPIARLYCIRSFQTEDVYYGSTVQTLSRRLATHVRDKKAGKNCSSVRLLEYTDYYIELIREVENITKEQLRRFEGELIRADPNSVNKLVAGRTQKEYCAENSEAINAKRRDRYHKNGEAVKTKERERYHKNSEAITAKRRDQYHKNSEAVKTKGRER